MKKLISFFLALNLFCGLGLYAQKVQGVKKSLPLSKGINLPGWMEYNRLNTLLYGKQDFENLKSMGVEIVRVPVWFEVWHDGSSEYKIVPECFEMIDKAVDWAKELGLYIIIDFHNDCNGSSKTNPKIEKILLKIWPQIAEHYKDKGSHIVYEVMNEPHFSSGNIKSDITKWGKIQGNVLKSIREIDKEHLIIVGGGDWNSLDSMLALPDYGDDKLIYNFHDYTPFLFTHQGATWTYTKRLTNIPFPYVKEKMPSLPKNATAEEKREWSGYEKNSSEEVLVAPLDKAVEFANKRNASLMCNEFGVYMKYAQPQERVNWYRIKCGWMAERNIIRVSWDYTQEFGVFNSTNETRFPEDLNAPLVEAMGFKVPGGKSSTWFANANKSGDWTIYKNGSIGLLKASAHNTEGILTYKIDSQQVINLNNINPYGQLCFSFGEVCDFSDLKSSGAKLEFFIKTSDKALNVSVYFRDMESKIFPWRAYYSINLKDFKADGEWHKVTVPLKDFSDIGGWTNEDGWKNGENKFSWKFIEALVFENGTVNSKSGFMLKDIKIVK
jgi:endoglucanase